MNIKTFIYLFLLGSLALMFFYTGIDFYILKEINQKSTVSIGISIIAAVLAGFMLALLKSKRQLTTAIKELTAVTEKVANGDFSCRVDTKMKGDLKDLAKSFNTMVINLAYLIQSTKSSAADINNKVQQIVNFTRLYGQNQQLTDDSSPEYKNISDTLQQSLAITGQLSNQSKHTMDHILQTLSEVNKTLQSIEEKAIANDKIAASLNKTFPSLESVRNTLAELTEKELDLTETFNQITDLLETSKTFTIEAALQAAHSGNTKLTAAAEGMNRIREEVSRGLEQLSQRTKNAETKWTSAAETIDISLEDMASNPNISEEMNDWLENVYSSLQQIKNNVEEIASTIHKQSSNIEKISENHTSILEKFTNFNNNNNESNSNLQIKPENLQDIHSLAKKLVRMSDRLNVLSTQFKT
ncbi:MAG: methyl-accepting chemotaxis protein [Peptococcaceae bacterium]|jgi:methyl-accepting chemotaxis protein|nr:MAG: methyl-accepting chemotaxis protein [Peptococcaceae bacterium]